MRAAIYQGPGQLSVEEVPPPALEEQSALVRVLRVGICGTDLKTFKRGHPLFPPPCVLGHEFVGKVERVSVGMEPASVGELSVFAPYLECGECALCRGGAPQLCKQKRWVNGTLADYVTVPAAIVARGRFALPAALDAATATLTEPLACAIHGIERARVEQGARVLVVGAGPMGMLLALSLKGMGCEVWVSEMHATRLTLAASLGLSTIDPGCVELKAHAAEHGLFASVILATEKEQLVPELLPLVAPGGTLELFGGMAKTARIELDPYHVHYREVDVVGSFGFALPHFRRAFAALCAQPAVYRQLISVAVPLARVSEGFAAAMQPENLKVVVEI